MRPAFSFYLNAVNQAVEAIDSVALSAVIEEINWARINRRRIWVAGNGGSAAIADHLVCDWFKGTHNRDLPPIDVHSLVANTPLLTACANDFGYNDCFAQQLAMRALRDDVLVVISSSGKSPNIVNAVCMARRLGLYSIAFTGFDGGEVGRLVNINLHVASNNYGVVEDCHQMLMHYIAQYIREMDHARPGSKEF